LRPSTISACLIVRNESLVLERCLSSLSGAVDEIIRALAFEPHHVLAHYLSGLSLMRLGRLAEAHPHLSAVKSSGKAGLSTAAELDALIAYCASN
jgi:hypothetical protein